MPRYTAKIDQAIADNLQLFRRIRELSQAQLANLSGIDLQRIIEMEACNTEIYAADIVTFSEVLQIPASQFFARRYVPYQNAANDEFSETDYKKIKEQLLFKIALTVSSIKDLSTLDSLVNMLLSIAEVSRKNTG